MHLNEALELALHRGEIGLQVAAYAGDEQVVNACAGVVSREPGATSVSDSTLFTIFSVSKSITAIAVHLQAERGLLDYNAPLATYWPEYARHGKGKITIQQVLSHRAGVPHMPGTLTPERIGDWNWIVERLEDVEPYCEPDTRNTYLSYSFGWLLGEVVRRTDPKGRSFSDFVLQELCTPLGITDGLWLGISPEVEPRVATLYRPEGTPVPKPGSLEAEAVPAGVLFDPSIYNLSAVRQASIPAAGGIANADAVARVFALLANLGSFRGVRLLSENRVLSFLQPRRDMLEVDDTYGFGGFAVGTGGFFLDIRQQGWVLPGPKDARSLCGAGSGGTIGWADLDQGISFAICHNRQFFVADYPPLVPLGDALWETAVSARRNTPPPNADVAI